MSLENLMLIAPPFTSFRVTVKDEKAREYLNIPAVAVACRSPFEDWPLPSDAPIGDGSLYVLMIRLPYTPPEDDPDEAGGNGK